MQLCIAIDTKHLDLLTSRDVNLSDLCTSHYSYYRVLANSKRGVGFNYIRTFTSKKLCYIQCTHILPNQVLPAANMSLRMYIQQGPPVVWYWHIRVTVVRYWHIRVTVVWYWHVRVTVVRYWHIRVTVVWYWHVRVTVVWYWYIRETVPARLFAL